MIELDAIPPLRGRRPRGAERVRRGSDAIGRRSRRGDTAPRARGSLLHAVTRTGAVLRLATLGLAALRVFPPAREAWDEGFRLAPGPNGDPGGAPRGALRPPSARHGPCVPGCGPSVVCADCCQTRGPQAGRHHTALTRAGYRLRPGGDPRRGDGRLRHYKKACGDCARGVVWRCHDGWKRLDSGHWYRTTCRWPVRCDR